MNNKNLRRLFVAIGLLSVSYLGVASAATSFTVTTIEIRGITRTDPGTVLNILPVKSGDEFELPEDTGRAIRALYETGLFDDVSLYCIDVIFAQVTGKTGHTQGLQHATEHDILEQHVFLVAQTP